LDLLNINQTMDECTFLFRRGLIALYKQGQQELAHALSVMWKTIVTSVDMMLTVDY
jgi:hypothetical protein